MDIYVVLFKLYFDDEVLFFGVDIWGFWFLIGILIIFLFLLMVEFCVLCIVWVWVEICVLCVVWVLVEIRNCALCIVWVWIEIRVLRILLVRDFLYDDDGDDLSDLYL